MSVKNKLNILKIGGQVLEDKPSLEEVLDYFIELSSPAILVHGGGRKASEMIHRLGMKPKMINGRRITDAASLEVVTMVYAGLTNKNLVAQLQAKGCNALGLSGADGNVIIARQRPVKDIDYGFAGDIEKINSKALLQLLDSGFTPVCCAITHNQKGQLLNTNADTIAATIAKELSAYYHVSLQFCFEKKGVLSDPDDENSIIPKMNTALYQTLRTNGVIHSGMVPKLDNAFDAFLAGANKVMIGNIDTLIAGNATFLEA